MGGGGSRLAHPLYGEVQRAQIGTLRARRLRGRIAGTLAATGGRRSDDTLRRAVLMLDSDLLPDSVLLTDAASRATELGDLSLAVRLARAAVAAGGGFEPRLLLSHALGWSNRGAEAETELAALGALACTDAQRAQAAITRVLNLAFALGRPTEAEGVLDAIASTISDDTAALELAGLRSYLDAFLGRSAQAAKAAAGVLSHRGCSPTATHLAGWGLAVARGDWAASRGLRRPCSGSTPKSSPSRSGCTGQWSSSRSSGCGGCSWRACWIGPIRPRGATASAARTPPDPRI
jgi:hypothetical protein